MLNPLLTHWHRFTLRRAVERALRHESELDVFLRYMMPMSLAPEHVGQVPGIRLAAEAHVSECHVVLGAARRRSPDDIKTLCVVCLRTIYQRSSLPRHTQAVCVPCAIIESTK